MEPPKVNQKEYLKKYLSSGDDTKQKKKKKIRIGPKKVKIIDDDIDLKNLRPLEDGEFDIFNSTEDAPQIAGIVDERGPVDFADKRRWKIIADDGEGNIAIASNNSQRDDVKNGDNMNRTVIDHSRNSSSKNKKNKNYSDNDQSSSKRLSKLSDNDLSPPRKSSSRRKKNSKKRSRKMSSSSSTSTSDSSTSSSSSNSTSRRKSKIKRHSSKTDKSKKYDSDLSPPRSSRKYPDRSRECVQSQDVELDLSPPRRSSNNLRNKNHERQHRRHNNSDSDLSPPRKTSESLSRKLKVNRGDNSDLSPPRKSRTSPRSFKHDDSNKNYDMSCRHREKSPRYRKSRWTDESRRSPSPQVDKRMKKTLDGKTAGLQDATALREETAAYKKREAEFFNEMSAEISGVGQAAVLRDRKTGRRRNLEAEAAEKREKEKRQEEIDAKYAKWGKGLKQVDDHTEKLKQDLYEMSKPLARYADDVDLDAQLRAVEREGDPMLEYIKQKQIKEGKREPDRPNYQGSYMPNRFGIKPGHRWDGVDRSNGYEKKWFEARNAKTAVQEEAYKWSTADM